jgi:hypothetical protein
MQVTPLLSAYEVYFLSAISLVLQSANVLSCYRRAYLISHSWLWNPNYACDVEMHHVKIFFRIIISRDRRSDKSKP